jgi:hypothetical protein
MQYTPLYKHKKMIFKFLYFIIKDKSKKSNVLNTEMDDGIRI